MMLKSIKSYPIFLLLILPVIHSLYSNNNNGTLNNSSTVETSTVQLLSNSSSFLHTKTPLITLAFNKAAESISPILFLPSTTRPESFRVNQSGIARLSSFREFNTSAIGIGTEGSYNATAASLDFIQLPACTESWWSRLAASNGTVMTTLIDILTVSLSSNSTTVHVPGGSGGIDVIGPTSQVFTMGTLTFRVYDNDVCCGDCNVLYPNVVVYYWPVLKNNNTWCLQYLNNSTSPASPSIPLNPPTSASPGPTLLPDMSLQGSMVNKNAPSFPKLPSQPLDPNLGPQVGFGAHLPPRAVQVPAVMSQPASPNAYSHSLQARTFVPLNESRVFAVVDGSTFISPSVYVVINTIKAVDKCKTIGHVFTSLTLSFQEDQLSTVDDMFGQTSRFDFADLPCPPENWYTNRNIPNVIEGNSAMQSYFVNAYRPRILVDQQLLKNLDPAWKSCNIIDIGSGYDPPRTLVPAGVLTDDAPTLAAKPTPAPHSVAESPGPTQTSEYSSIAHSPSTPTNDPPAKPENIPNSDRPNSTQPPARIAISPGDPPPPPPLNNGVVISTLHENPGEPRIGIHEEPSDEGKNTPVSILPANSPVLPLPPLIAGGFKFTPAQAQATPHAVPIAIGDFILAPFNPKTTPADPEPKPNAPVIVDGLILNPAPQKPTSAKPIPNPVVVGGLTFIPEIPVPILANPELDPATGGSLASTPGKQGAIPGGLLNPTPVPLGTIGGNPVFVDHYKAVAGGTTVFAGTGSTVIDGTPIGLGNAALTIGTNIIPIPAMVTPYTKNPNLNPLFLEPTVFSVGEIRISRGGPEVTLSGTPVSFGMMGLVVGSKTIPVNPESVAKNSLLLYEMEGKTLTQGGPAVTISGTQISLGSSNIIIGTRTIDLPTTLVLAAASRTAAIDLSGYSVAGKFLAPGGPMITVSGTKISLGSSNLVIGTKTVPLATNSPSESTIVIAGQTFTAYSTGFIIDGNPLSPGGPAITISGTRISLGSSQIQIGTQNFLWTSPFSATAPPVLTIDGKALTANPSGFSIGGAELSFGGPQITISGTPMSLGSMVIVIGTSIVSLSQPPNPTGLGPSITSGSGFPVIATPIDRSSSPNPDAFLGAQGKLGTSAMLISLCFGINIFIMTRLM